MIFTFLKFLILSFLFFSVTNEIADVYLHFYDILTPLELEHMRHFLIIIIGHSNFLNICEDLIYLFNHNVWFSLYESHSPSYFICYNTTNPQSLATVLEIDINQIQHFT